MGSEQVVLFGDFSEDESAFFQSLPLGPQVPSKGPPAFPLPVAEEQQIPIVHEATPPLPPPFAHGHSHPFQPQPVANGGPPPHSFPVHATFEARPLPLPLDPSVPSSFPGAAIGGGLMVPPHVSWPPRMEIPQAGPIGVPRPPPPPWASVVNSSPSHVGPPPHVSPSHPQLMMMMMNNGIPPFPMPPPPQGGAASPVPSGGPPFMPLPHGAAPSHIVAEGLPLRPPFPPPHLPSSSISQGSPVGPMTAYSPMLIRPPPAPPLHPSQLPLPQRAPPHEEGLHMLPLPPFAPSIPVSSALPQMAIPSSLPKFAPPYVGSTSCEGVEAGRSSPVVWPPVYRPPLGTPNAWTAPSNHAPPAMLFSQPPPPAQVPFFGTGGISGPSGPASLAATVVPPNVALNAPPPANSPSLQVQSLVSEGGPQSSQHVETGEPLATASASSLEQHPVPPPASWEPIGLPQEAVRAPPAPAPEEAVQRSPSPLPSPPPPPPPPLDAVVVKPEASADLPPAEVAPSKVADTVSVAERGNQPLANGVQETATTHTAAASTVSPQPSKVAAPPLLPTSQLQQQQQQEGQAPLPAVSQPPVPASPPQAAGDRAPPAATSAPPAAAPPPPIVPAKPKTWAKLFNQVPGESSHPPSSAFKGAEGSFPGAHQSARAHAGVGQSGRSSGLSAGEPVSVSTVSSSLPAGGAPRHQHAWGPGAPGDGQRQGLANGVQNSTTAGSSDSGTSAPLSLTGTAWVNSVVQAESSSAGRVHVLPRGLVNAGNTCFLNATLQGLLACSPFCHLLQLLAQLGPSLRPDLYPTLYAFSKFLREFELVRSPAAPSPAPSGGNRAIDVGRPFAPAMFDAVLARFSGTKFHVAAGPEIRKSMKQEDAQEFLLFLMDRMHEELLLLEGGNGGGGGSQGGATPPSSAATTVPQAASGGPREEEEWETVGPKNRTSVTRTHASSGGESAVSDIFGGHLRSVVKTKGAKPSATVQPFLLLQLDIVPTSVQSLEDALKLFAAPESLDGYKAVGAGRADVVTAKKEVKLQSLPRVLVLHLMRFSYGPKGSSKVHKPVPFPATLTLSPKLLALNGPSNEEARRYELAASVSHRGKELSGGHYTADVRQPSGQWLRFDDSHVTPIPLKVALHDQAYLLIYKRVLVSAGNTGAASVIEDA